MLSCALVFLYNSPKASFSVPMDFNTVIMLLMISIVSPAWTSPLSSRLSYPTAFLYHKHLILTVPKMELDLLYSYTFLSNGTTILCYSSKTPESSLPFPLCLRSPSFPAGRLMDSVSKIDFESAAFSPPPLADCLPCSQAT